MNDRDVHSRCCTSWPGSLDHPVQDAGCPSPPKRHQRAAQRHTNRLKRVTVTAPCAGPAAITSLFGNPSHARHALRDAMPAGRHAACRRLLRIASRSRTLRARLVPVSLAVSIQWTLGRCAAVATTWPASLRRSVARSRPIAAAFCQALILPSQTHGRGVASCFMSRLAQQRGPSSTWMPCLICFDIRSNARHLHSAYSPATISGLVAHPKTQKHSCRQPSFLHAFQSLHFLYSTLSTTQLPSTCVLSLVRPPLPSRPPLRPPASPSSAPSPGRVPRARP